MECLPIYGHSSNKQEFAKLTYKEITKGIAYDPDEVLKAWTIFHFFSSNKPSS